MDALIGSNITVGEFDDNSIKDDLPSMQDPGRILFRLWPNEDFFGDRVEILDYDNDKAPFWLNEGGFMDSVIADIVHLELEGFYVLEGVTGRSWQAWDGEYDEEWEFELCRRASESESEIRTEALDD